MSPQEGHTATGLNQLGTPEIRAAAPVLIGWGRFSPPSTSTIKNRCGSNATAVFNFGNNPVNNPFINNSIEATAPRENRTGSHGGLLYSEATSNRHCPLPLCSAYWRGSSLRKNFDILNFNVGIFDTVKIVLVPRYVSSCPRIKA